MRPRTRQLAAEWRRLIQPGSAGPEPKQDNKTILVVDDDKEVNACLGFTLQAAGYRVLSAFDGDEGLATALERQPDAVVLDVRMPKRDGLGMLPRAANS